MPATTYDGDFFGLEITDGKIHSHGSRVHRSHSQRSHDFIKLGSLETIIGPVGHKGVFGIFGVFGDQISGPPVESTNVINASEPVEIVTAYLDLETRQTFGQRLDIRMIEPYNHNLKRAKADNRSKSIWKQWPIIFKFYLGR